MEILVNKTISTRNFLCAAVMLSSLNVAYAKQLPDTVQAVQPPPAVALADRPDGGGSNAVDSSSELGKKAVSPGIFLLGLTALIISRRSPRTELFATT
jgi:hypothetical protein